MPEIDIWRDVRRKVLDTLQVAVPAMPFEMKVIIAEDAARDVQDYATPFPDGSWPLDGTPRAAREIGGRDG